MNNYAFGFGGQAPRKGRKAKPRVKAAPQQEQPVNHAGRWIQDPVTKQWVFQKATQPIIAKSPIVVRMPVRPAHVPAPNMKAMVQPAPRPIRITAQHRTRRGGLTRRNDR